MKIIDINIWDDFEGYEDKAGGKTFAYIESGLEDKDKQEYVLHSVASMLATVQTEVKYNSYYPESEYGYSRWELVLYGVNEEKICAICDYFGQLNHVIHLDDKPFSVEVYSES
ncbi:hypothetical protein [Aeromonas phage AS-yj]|uniref:Uncharacterized protein n=4 Tax=Ceceduovirus TaxID=2842588 RepID=A0A291LEY7_9CAUD|nr:hypothetical protein HWB28_gp140 [Aeromonas phage AS-zj]YP_009835075.1 hypothetical protein HWB29_gp373 [Aeromonas phage AS-sw]ATI17585.1 hypothetical protein [Aeromonas phage AS-szw]ATI17923.1 hypothetical protein [Aeromonas phage AS-yj]ASU00412.1 hypothetical protein [Aeromonas phage AS-zj]ATI18423.1 hypothetical protein [Aeromonas phage AS-sw]